MTDTLERREARHLIASNKVEGTAVYNRGGERLGTITHFMVDKVSGRAEFAVMEFGGLLGIGTDRYPLPWDMLTYDVDRGGYVADIGKARLDEAPRYSDVEPAYDRDYEDMVETYYRDRPGPFI